ncbi:MAG: hypothetical protein NTV51_17000 [Verrucomicrobia bacterium]|nr:hypothetical protein [Verrucomicrobiota bacterium]
MSAATAISVASYSVVLAETFAAVGLSSLIPAGVVTAARVAKNLAAQGSTTPPDALKGNSSEILKALPIPTAEIDKLLLAVKDSLPALDLLLPKTAKLHAEFTYEAREQYTLDYSANGALSYEGLVTAGVKAGFHALYEEKSTNKITLDVEFVSVHVPL